MFVIFKNELVNIVINLFIINLIFMYLIEFLLVFEVISVLDIVIDFGYISLLCFLIIR